MVQFDEIDDEVCDDIDVFKEEIQEPKFETVKHKPNWDVDRISKFIEFRCDICPSLKLLSDYSNWKNHMKIDHNDDNPIFICCDSKLRTERALLTHVNKFHDNTRKRRFKCSICLKEFEHKSQIRTHMRVHQRHVEDGYQCKKCPETFLRGTHWRTHQLVHVKNATLDDILFPCKQCPKELATYKDLKAHVRHKHKKKFLCDLCAQVFYIKFQLKVHIRKFHMPEPLNKEKCTHCGNTFLNKSNLNSHIKLMHTGKGRFPCDKCDKIAITEKQLQKHDQFTHQMNRTFQCKFCPKGRQIFFLNVL